MCVGDIVKNLSLLIKPASSLCNFDCIYCFYHDVAQHRQVQNFGLMSDDVTTALIRQAVAIDDNSLITFAFQGGEPTLAGLDYFEGFTQQVSNMKKPNQIIHYSIQTNGYLIDQQWCKLFSEHRFLVGLSMDGFKENHDQFRLTRQNQPTFDRVMETTKLLRKNQIDFNILTVLTSELARRPKELYEFYKENDFRYVQLIPCFLGLDQSDDLFTLKPIEFAYFYKEFYTAWHQDYIQGHYISVSMFDNIIPMFRGFPPQQCGLLGFCSPQYVVETNGNVYPCDFYVLDKYVCGNVLTNTFDQIRDSKAMTDFLREDKRMSVLCHDCSFRKMCYGNCKRMNITMFDDEGCGYKEFLEFAHSSMKDIARNITMKG